MHSFKYTNVLDFFHAQVKFQVSIVIEFLRKFQVTNFFKMFQVTQFPKLFDIVDQFSHALENFNS